MISQKFLQLFIIFGVIINPNFFIPGSMNNENDYGFSVYNNNWNGCSSFREEIESRGYEVMSVESDLSAVSCINKSICLVLLGPNRIYNPIIDIPFFIDFFTDNSTNNSLLLCHDHGSTNELLWEIFIASMLNFVNTTDPADLFPVTIFPDGVLRDNQSCLENAEGLKDTSFPIIKSFPNITDPGMSAIKAGINEVILSNATAAAGGDVLIQAFGWKIIGQASQDYSFVDKNGNKKWDNDTDVIDLSFIADLIGGSLGGVDLSNASEFLKLPLGGSLFTPAVFLAKELNNSRVFVSSDASLFSNDLIDEYDNQQFGMNIIDWLTYNGIDDPDDWVIVFDEAHNRLGTSISAGNIIIISLISIISVIVIVKRIKLKNRP